MSVCSTMQSAPDGHVGLSLCRRKVRRVSRLHLQCSAALCEARQLGHGDGGWSRRRQEGTEERRNRFRWVMTHSDFVRLRPPVYIVVMCTPMLFTECGNACLQFHVCPLVRGRHYSSSRRRHVIGQT